MSENLKKMIKFLRFAFILSAVFILNACNEKITDELIQNKAPNTFISLFPEQGVSQQQSRLQVHWWGDDADGLVVGYYVTWDNVHWSFTNSNDSTFALKIGAKDTSYVFKVAAVDNGGNGIYDNAVVQNGINFGPEPFVDKNGDGKYNQDEIFFDIGLIDPEPADLKFPIKNSAPAIGFNSLTVLPDTSYPIMTIGWDASDLDGDESIVKINIALNDTTKFISLPGSTRLVMLRVRDFSNLNAQAEVLINASEGHINPEKLAGLNLNANNRIYVQAEDISGAKSKFNMLPSESRSWYVKKPVSNFLVIDDNVVLDDASAFYKTAFDALKGGSFAGKYEVWDLGKNKVPYDNITFYETLKLFKYIFWYSDNNPTLSLASVASRKFIDNGGKIAFSMIFPQTVDLPTLQGFLPVDSVGTVTAKDFTVTLFGNTAVKGQAAGYPDLKTVSSIFRIRSFYPTPGSVVPLYNLETTQLSGNKIIGFRDTQKKLFFIGLPLHKSDGNPGNVKTLLEKIIFEDFGLIL